MEDITGKVYGRLTVTGRAPDRKKRRYWECVCTCGTKKIVSETHLKQGHTRSCGCLVRESGRHRASDLTGRTFGRLTVLKRVGSGKDGAKWLCQCDCGKQMLTYTERLTSGHTRSCGCLQSDTRKQTFQKSVHFVEGTCVERIRTMDPVSRHNKTGYSGVYLSCDGKYRAMIQFKGRKYDLGRYVTVEEAKNAREKTQEKLWGNFLREYDYAHDNR